MDGGKPAIVVYDEKLVLQPGAQVAEAPRQPCAALRVPRCRCCTSDLVQEVDAGLVTDLLRVIWSITSTAFVLSASPPILVDAGVG